MRRKCRLTDTWLTQRVLLDSWNVTLSQGAERCTLNLSLSNNRCPSICLLELNVEMTDLLRQENISDTFSACPIVKQRSKRLVLITKCKCFLFFFSDKHKYSNVENLHKRPCIVIQEHSMQHRNQGAQREVREERFFCTPVGKTEPIKGYSSWSVEQVS